MTRPLTVYLAKKRVMPEHLSVAGLLMALPFVYFFGFNPLIAFVFLILNVIFDGLDGPLARLSGNRGNAGAFTDLACDHLSFLVIFMTLFHYQLMSSFWGALYLVNYFLMLSMVVYCRAVRIRFFPVIRSKYAVYAILFLWLLTTVNVFDPVLVFFTVYMVITNYFLFERIRWSLR